MELFEYVGRKDRRVKVRGLWADLSEIEAAVREMDAVADAVAISVGAEAGVERLCVFIVPAQDAEPPSSGEVRRWVAQQTASHMAPADVRRLNEIPRLANFKPDLVRLRSLLDSTA